MGSGPGGSLLRLAAPFPHWGSRTECLLNYELAQGWAVAAPLSPLVLHCPLCTTMNQPGHSLKRCCLLSTRTLKCVSQPSWLLPWGHGALLEKVAQLCVRKSCFPTSTHPQYISASDRFSLGLPLPFYLTVTI